MLVALLATAGLAACGGDDDDDVVAVGRDRRPSTDDEATRADESAATDELRRRSKTSPSCSNGRTTRVIKITYTSDDGDDEFTIAQDGDETAVRSSPATR